MGAHLEDMSSGLVFRVTRDNRRVEGAFLLLTFVMRLKNDITMVVGPTDDDGVILVSSDDIATHFETTTHMAIMDYRPDTWTRQVAARVMTEGDVRRYVGVADIWGPDAYPPGQAKKVRGWGARLPQHPESLELTADVVGDADMTIELRPLTSTEDSYDKLRWRPER